jgi:alpha-L-rhamnosidase
MRQARAAVPLFLLLAAASSAVAQRQTALDELRRSFLAPPADSRIMMRWWWFGPTVTKPQLERELRLMKDGGIGGVEVQPVYPLVLDDAASGFTTLSYLSDAFIDALRFTGVTARELGLRVDLTIGSGWPYGGPQVGVEQAAGKLRIERAQVPASLRVAVPNIGAGEQLIAAFLAAEPGTAPAELSGFQDGVVRVPPGSQGAREVLFFIASRTGMMVKRPAAGAEGFVLNHYDRAALDLYLKSVGDRLLTAFGDNPPHAVFSDSLEVYESDWTTDFLDQFRTRRGYDLKPHLPALVADNDPQSAGLRHDWGQTLTELLNERFAAPMQEWAHRHRTLFRFQGYGTPPATLSTNAHADLPEGEGAQWKTLSATRWASSASHVYGRPVTSSETWTWLHSPVFRATPLDLKAEADLHFLQGINQLIGHGWPYTAEGVEYPGWRFYAAAVFNEKNPWWIVMPDVSLYLQRVSFLMRHGTPDNDIALYLPTSDAWAHFSPGHVNTIETLRERLGPDVIPSILESGYGFDAIDDEALRASSKVEGNTLRVGSASYRAVILPGVERIPAETLRVLEQFARSGGVVIATRRLPDLAPGFAASEADRAQIRESAQRLFQGTGAAAHFVRSDGAELGAALAKLLRPDIAFSPAAPELGFVHRHSDGADVYFVANTANVPQRVDATFRMTGMGVEAWDPIHGTVTRATPRAAANGGTTIALDLEPYGSRVLVFSRGESPVLQKAAAARRAAAATEPIDLSTGWTVSFGANGSPTTFDRLRSWTDDDATRYFSGQATYTRDITIPAEMIGRERRFVLDFGEGTPIPAQPLRSGMQAWLDAPVREAAVVYVNDRRAGSVWCPPYSVDVTEALQRGANHLRIVVANLAVNYMAGHALPNYRLLNLRYGVRFDAQDMDKVQAVPAGLLGQIRLVAREADAGGSK